MSIGKRIDLFTVEVGIREKCGYLIAQNLTIPETNKWSRKVNTYQGKSELVQTEKRKI